MTKPYLKYLISFLRSLSMVIIYCLFFLFIAVVVHKKDAFIFAWSLSLLTILIHIVFILIKKEDKVFKFLSIIGVILGIIISNELYDVIWVH